MQMGEARKRIEEYAKLRKTKQINKSDGGYGKDRTIYQMRKSKFLAKDKTLGFRSISELSDFQEFSTQMSSRSLEDCPRMRIGK